MDVPASNADLAPPPASSASVWRGVLLGLIPLGVLVALVALAVGITVLARQLSMGQGFLVEQQVVVLVATISLAIAAAAYAVACFFLLRRVGRWQRAGQAALATGALWALGATALIVVLPVLVALLMPQYPAP